MCGRYTLIFTDSLGKRYATAVPESLRSSYNVAPGQSMPVVIHNGSTTLEIMKWGLVPSWAKDIKIGYKMINARSETVAEKPYFRSAFKRRRCLVPASGFYEWKREGELKTPIYIHLQSEELFSFAGLYEHWQDSLGNELMSYTILTTAANELMEPIHDRMPVILKKEDEHTWIDPEHSNLKMLQQLLVPYDSTEMQAYAVSPDVNSVRNNIPSLIKHASPQPTKEGGVDSY